MAPLPKGFYRVEDGDSWAKIAGKLTGDQRNFLRLMEANGGSLHSGMVIKIPGSVRDGPAFIGNDKAASLGLATSNQVRDAYAANGTGGVGSPRLPMGGFQGGYAEQNKVPLNATVANVGSGLAPFGYGNNPNTGLSVPSTLPAPRAQDTRGELPYWELATPNLGPSYTVPGVGQSPANAFRQATQPQQPGEGGHWMPFATPKTQGPNPVAPGTSMPTQTPTRATQTTGNTMGQTISESIFGKTELNPGEKLYSPTAQNGQVVAQPTGATVQGPQQPQYTQAQVDAAQQKLANGYGTITDYKIGESVLIAQGYTAEEAQKMFAEAYPEQAAKLFQDQATESAFPNADSATSGWNWNQPTASGYVSPSGYFVPYGQPKGEDTGLYDFETGRVINRPGSGGPRRPRPVPGVKRSNLRIGLITWRY